MPCFSWVLLQFEAEAASRFLAVHFFHLDSTPITIGSRDNRLCHDQTHRPGEPAVEWLASVIRGQVLNQSNICHVSASMCRNSKQLMLQTPGRKLTDISPHTRKDMPPAMQLEHKTPRHPQCPLSLCQRATESIIKVPDPKSGDENYCPPRS
jgi:hypothetical protein